MSDARRDLLARLFPGGVPRLWCPLVTHARGPREPDPERTRRHVETIAPFVGGLLVPGSTGEGWAMTDADAGAALAAVVGPAREAGVRLLVGVLRHTTAEVLAGVESALGHLRRLTGAADPADAMAAAGVVGITVCPPRGADLGQHAIESAVTRVLDLGLPTALYQLPQVTLNEAAPETVARLAARHPNLILFKDTSGADRVALSGADLGGVLLLRGAEGDYARWPAAAGGPYHGFLLSSANAFAAQLGEVLRLLDAGRRAEADALSGRVARAVAAAFAVAAGCPGGNVFAAANKLLDHVMAHGPDPDPAEPPLLFTGERLPAEAVAQAAELLRGEGLLPAGGYLAGGPPAGSNHF